jgi:hypothetical protein
MKEKTLGEYWKEQWEEGRREARIEKEEAKKKKEEKKKLEDIGQILPWEEKEDIIRPRIKLMGKKLGMFRLVQAITGWSDKEIVDEALSHFLKSKYVKTMLESLKEELEQIDKEEFWMGI